MPYSRDVHHNCGDHSVEGIKAYATASVSRAGEEVDRFIFVTSGSI
jgi:hypothetical protein